MKRNPKDNALEQSPSKQPRGAPHWLSPHTPSADWRAHLFFQQVFIEHLPHTRHLGKRNEWPCSRDPYIVVKETGNKQANKWTP